MGSIRPEPTSSGPAGVVPSSSTTLGSADVISADLIAASDQAGSSWARRAAAPATSGDAIDVPLMIWNVSPGRSPLTGVGVAAARMFTPGAPTSGLAMSGTAASGPREEKAAIKSLGPAAGCPPPMTSVGDRPARSVLMAAPSAADTCTAGTQWRSATTSSSGLVLASTRPTPPASRTTFPFSTRPFWPRWQRTALPATAARSSEPGRHSAALSTATPAAGTAAASTSGAPARLPVSDPPFPTTASGTPAGLPPGGTPGMTENVDSNVRPSVVAATDVTQGTPVGDPIVPALGPSLPAALATNTPAAAAPRNARSTGPNTAEVAEPTE